LTRLEGARLRGRSGVAPYSRRCRTTHHAGFASRLCGARFCERLACRSGWLAGREIDSTKGSQDPVAVINWLHALIEVRVHRALHGLAHDAQEDRDWPPLPRTRRRASRAGSFTGTLFPLKRKHGNDGHERCKVVKLAGHDTVSLFRFLKAMGSMTRRQLLAAVTMLAGAGIRPFAQKGPAVQVYKDATCGCCALWVEHLRKAGFSATVTDAEDMTAVKAKYGVPNQARSCHTAIVDGYVIEGHVPAVDVQRLLKERPGAVGLAVPGMPIGSPGMEVASVKPQPYDVLAFDKAGRTTVFASHGR
jgi:hypothetical protein